MILKINYLRYFKLISFYLSILYFSNVNGQGVKLSGCIKNPNKDKVEIWGPKRFYKVIDLVEGCFSDSLKIEISGEYTFSDGNESTAMYLENGYNLNISLDTKEFDETIIYKGIGEKPNNFFAKYYLYNEQKEISYKLKVSMTEQEYFNRLNEYYKGLFQLIDDSKLDNKKFEVYQKDRFKYEMLNNILGKSGDSYFSNQSIDEINNYVLSTLKTLDFNNDSLYKSSNYFKNCFNNYYKLGLIANNQECINSFDNELTELQRKFITSLIARGISFYSEDNIEANYQALTRIVKDNKELAKYTDLYNKIKSLEKGNPSPSFSNKSIDGDTVSLMDLEGKLVYIDVWATWCGPCKAQFPYLKKLEEEYRGKDVTFVSISIDDPKSEDKWRKMVKDEELKGIQLIAENAWKSSFAQDYVIRGIPRFILLDKKGNIISPFAPQPAIYDDNNKPVSNKEINNLLDEYLN
jgi:thiol-disulfide isomerase/thioredoxin